MESATMASTRAAMHRLAEHLLSPARHAVTGRIGLRPTPNGIATPPFGDDERVLAIEGSELVLRSTAGERRAPIRTLRAAAEFAGVELAPTGVYTPTTALEPEAPLDLDPAAVQALADWFGRGERALGALADEIPAEQPSAAQLWPEHFDLAISAGEVNYGCSPGDDQIAEPYLYVGPFEGPPAADEFWNAPFGAVVTIAQIGSDDDALAFFRRGHELIQRARGRR